MARVGVVVCTYNIENHMPVWIQNVLNGINMQQFPGQVDVLISDNKSSKQFLDILDQYCEANTVGNKTYSYISYPDQTGLFNTLNLGLHLLSSTHNYDYFAYSSDDNWLQSEDGLKLATDEFCDSSIGIVSIQSNLDNTVRPLLVLNSLKGPSVTLSLEEHVNLHFALFSREFMQAYNFRYMDAIVAYGNESLLRFFCEAIGKQWVMSRSSTVFNGKKNRFIRNAKKKGAQKGAPMGYFVAPEVGMSMKDLLETGKSVGMGFNCWYSPLPHKAKQGMKLPADFFIMDCDPACYKNGKCKDRESLFRFIKDNMFIKNPRYNERLSKSTRRIKL